MSEYQNRRMITNISKRKKKAQIPYIGLYYWNAIYARIQEYDTPEKILQQDFTEQDQGIQTYLSENTDYRLMGLYNKYLQFKNNEITYKDMSIFLDLNEYIEVIN
jgi:hypothetical protein